MSIRTAASQAVRAALAALIGQSSAGGHAAPVKAKSTNADATTAPRDSAHAVAVLQPVRGVVTIRFFADRAPNHVKNFVDLAASGFYDGTLFHR
ncbi:MAG: peptidylprolyl isomerase, partial [Thermoanaerobaculia bacterium]